MTRLVPMAITVAAVLTLCADSHAVAAEPCTHAVSVRDGKAHDPETGAVVPLCDGDLLPTEDVLWLLEREGRATEVASAIELAKSELAAERDLHKVDVDRLAAEIEAQRTARLACERERSPVPLARRPFYDSPWFGGAVGAFIGVSAVVATVLLTR